MAKIVILGAGISGHTAASFLKTWLGKEHEIVVVTPNSKWNWIPSNIWVGVGGMTKENVVFELEGGKCKDAYKIKAYDEDKPFISQKAMVE